MRSRWTGAAGRGAPLASMERCKRAVGKPSRDAHALVLGKGMRAAHGPDAQAGPELRCFSPPSTTQPLAVCRALCMLVRWALTPYLSYGIPVTALKLVNVFNRLPRDTANTGFQ